MRGKPLLVTVYNRLRVQILEQGDSNTNPVIYQLYYLQEFIQLFWSPALTYKAEVQVAYTLQGYCED